MSRNRACLVALLAASSLFLVSEAWAIKPIAPQKKQDQQKKDKAAGKQAPGTKASVKAAPAAKKPSKDAAKTEGGKVLPRALNPAALAAKVDSGDGERIVITNDDLSRIYGRSNAKAVEPDYGRFLSQVERQRSTQQRKTAQQAKQSKSREARAGELRQEIDRLRKKLLGQRNPLLPRGKSTDAEAKREKGMDNVQRVAATKAAIAKLEAELLKHR